MLGGLQPIPSTTFTLHRIRQVLSESVQNVTCAEMPVLLDPEAYVSCSGHYVLTQEDIDEGMVTNEVGIYLYMRVHRVQTPDAACDEKCGCFIFFDWPRDGL